MSKALFLDRDGTLNFDVHHLHKPEELRLIPGVREALRQALDAGYLLFLFTNQSGVGRGYFTMEDVHACNRRLCELLDLGEPLFKDICIAPEKPDEPSLYRKPSPRFILEMASRYKLDPTLCYMVGDRSSDWEAALNAGINPVAVKSGKPIGEEELHFIQLNDIPLYDDLGAFVQELLERPHSHS